MIDKIYDNFKLPIEYCEKSEKIMKNLDQDLELTQKNVGSEISVYEKILNPTTKIGKQCIKPFSQNYTTDESYLKDTQKLYESIDTLKIDKETIENTWECYTLIKNDNNFYDKYQYIEWDKFKWLNQISTFLFVFSLYNLSSPIINLFSPLFILIVPFIILKIMRMPVTVDTYSKILLQQLKNHAIGKIFTQWNTVKSTQKVYLLFCAGLYVYNIYNNILSCMKFYRNTKNIGKTFDNMSNYLEQTIHNMDYYSNKISKLESYNGFNITLKSYKEKLFHYKNKIDSLPKKKLSYKNILYLGNTMKEFYYIYNSSEFQDILQYSFAFNGYLDVTNSIKKQIQSKLLNKVKILKKKKSTLKFKNFYNPLIEEKKAIKNNISLKKNKIITGPNASGKTTLLKSCAINILLCQQVGFGYVESGKITPFHYIHCYMNIPDTNGRDSLFQAEARRCLDILKHMDKHKYKRHFAVFDELYSGTNPYEAISSAYSYLKYISKNTNVKFILTTHYIKLCELMKQDKNKTENCNMETIINNDNPTYKYKIKKGISKIKGGVCVLKQLLYPEKIIKNTKNILETI